MNKLSKDILKLQFERPLGRLLLLKEINTSQELVEPTRHTRNLSHFEGQSTKLHDQDQGWDQNKLQSRFRNGEQQLFQYQNYQIQQKIFVHNSVPNYAYQLKVPQLAESITEGELSEILVKEGDIIKTDTVVAKIATDKVAVDVFYTERQSAKVLKINGKEGDTVNVAQVLAELEQGDFETQSEQTPQQQAPPQKQQQLYQKPEEQQQQAPKVQVQQQQPSQQAPISPPSQQATPLDPTVRERRVKMSRLRKRVSERLKGAQNTFALLTTFQECDMTNLMALRTKYKDEFNEKHGVKLGFMSGFVKAASYALKELPVVNGVIDGDEIIYRDYIDISIAVASAKGLVVPVIRDADKLNFADVERTINNLGKKARDGTIGIDDMAGGTFTISNGGVYGSLLSTPIINPPQSAILGMHSIQQRPAVVNGLVVARPLMYIALTYDHRLIDGREAVMFLRKVKDVVEDPTRLLLDI